MLLALFYVRVEGDPVVLLAHRLSYINIISTRITNSIWLERFASFIYIYIANTNGKRAEGQAPRV